MHVLFLRKIRVLTRRQMKGKRLNWFLPCVSLCKDCATPGQPGSVATAPGSRVRQPHVDFGLPKHRHVPRFALFPCSAVRSPGDETLRRCSQSNASSLLQWRSLMSVLVPLERSRAQGAAAGAAASPVVVTPQGSQGLGMDADDPLSSKPRHPHTPGQHLHISLLPENFHLYTSSII